MSDYENQNEPARPPEHVPTPPTPMPPAPGAPDAPGPQHPTDSPGFEPPPAAAYGTTGPAYGTTGPAYDTTGPAYGSTGPAPGPAFVPYGGAPLPSAEPARATPWRMRALAGATLVAVALGSGVAGAEIASREEGGTVVSSVVASPASGATGPTESLAKVAAAVSPSVVSIAVTSSTGASSGSGIVLRSNGTILTNNHVVAAAASGATIRVKFTDGKTAAASLVGRDPSSDLAVIRADGVSGRTPATLASSDSVHVGDTVLAIGSPLGLDGSVSAGIVSALHRPVGLGSDQQQDPFGGQSGASSGTLADAIQTDAPINPGNSGGALVDAQGRVIGINTAIATLGAGTGGQSGNIGVGFAIPIDQAAEVADTLLRGDTPVHAVLGVQTSDSPSAAGAVIGAVTPSSAAAEAGLQEGDVIEQVGGRTVSDATDLAAAVRSHKPGDKVEVRILRDGKESTVTATLGSATS
jgi:putative serine protease PepD